MSSQVDIVNRALLAIGARAQVSSIDPSDGSVAGDAAAVLFTPTFEMLARSAHWNFLKRQADLNVLKAAQGTLENPDGLTLGIPPIPWTYSYAYPSDCLKMRSLVPANNSDLSPGIPLMTNMATSMPVYVSQNAVPFSVAYDVDNSGNPIQVVLTNMSQATAIYTVNQPNPVIWDSLFQQAMVASLAAFFVPALSLHMGLMQVQIKLAESIIHTARTQDANEGTQSQDHIPDWITQRGYSGFYGTLPSMYGYDEMRWPATTP